jgi:dipeptidyl aminopeptidase/acylaminoacyl peptidase
LAQEGLVDRSRLAIRGTSAGAFTTLACLTSRSEVFSAAAAYYAIADLESLARQTHKFESHYHDTLIGPYPQRRDLYVLRSPIHHAEALHCALILFHGSEDSVVAPDQSRRMFDAACRSGMPAAFLSFSGEGHGFRQATTITKALQAELYFFSRIFRFQAAESLEAIRIENLPRTG